MPRAEWPERPVKLIVTFPPGSANDAAARIFADGLGKKMGQAGRCRGSGPVRKAPSALVLSSRARTTTRLLYTVTGSVTVAPLLIDKLPYDVDRDLQPIAATTVIALTLAVSNQLAVRSIPELIEAVRSNPGKYAWTSAPTLPRYVFAAFLKRNGLADEFRELPRCRPAAGRSRRGPDPGPGDIADGVLLPGAGRQGPLSRRH